MNFVTLTGAVKSLSNEYTEFNYLCRINYLINYVEV